MNTTNNFPLLLVLLSLSAAAHAGGEWTFPAGDYANTRFSDLTEIDRGNVAKLKLAFSFSTGVLRGHEAAPVVAGNTMYVITPFPNYRTRSISPSPMRRSSGVSSPIRKQALKASPAATM